MFLPDWHTDRSPDPAHPHRRRFTPAYRRKRELVKHIWIGAGLIMAVSQAAAVIGVMALATTLLSFVVLDESA